MVASIISAIDGSLTQDTEYQDNSIRNYLYRKADTLTFHQATRQLREYANVTNGGMLPTRLESLYLNKNFDQFMEPLLRLTHDDPYQSKIHPSNYIANNQPPIENPLTSFKKVESS